MKPHHKSYLKTTTIAAGIGSILAILAVVLVLLVGDQHDMPLIGQIRWLVPIIFLAAAYFFAVGVGGVLCLYRDITRNGRP